VSPEPALDLDLVSELLDLIEQGQVVLVLIYQGQRNVRPSRAVELGGAGIAVVVV